MRSVIVSKPVLLFIIFFLPFLIWWLLSHLQNSLVIALLGHVKVKAFIQRIHLFLTCVLISPGGSENRIRQFVPRLLEELGGNSL
jgi:hypothetical protein